MGLFTKSYQIAPNQIGYFYKDNVFVKKLSPGFYTFLDWKKRTFVITLPTVTRLITINNQEVLTRDNIALRFSFIIKYKIMDGEKMLSNFEFGYSVYSLLTALDEQIYSTVQIAIREKICALNSEELNEQREQITDFKNDAMNIQLEELGVYIEQALLKDITFPKSIQNLFARHLEAKIRAKADLENARTTVATARALKNAAEMMKDDENIRFFQWVETLNKIAEKGRHTFMIGDVPQATTKSSK